MRSGDMKRTSFIVTYRRNGVYSQIEFFETYATSAQEAVDILRYESGISPYEVVECYKKVSNWS